MRRNKHEKRSLKNLITKRSVVFAMIFIAVIVMAVGVALGRTGDTLSSILPENVLNVFGDSNGANGNSELGENNENSNSNIASTNVSTSFLASGINEYTEAIPSVSIESTEDYSTNTPGSWHIDKSAEWTEVDSAKVTFDVKSTFKGVENQRDKDVILVLDSSGSMSGSKIDKVKKDSKELVESLLQNANNKVALITFATSSEKVLDLTNDKDSIVSKIDSMNTYGTTNYNAALKNVDSIMENYSYEDNRDLIVLFLTDGYPCEDTPNQVGTFQLLKNKYPDMIVNGVQYEMGSSIKQELKEVSDIQWFADMETLNNILFDAVQTVDSVKYDSFEIVDYIDKDYYVLNSEDDIEVTVGTVKLEEENGLQKITWTIGKPATGFNAKMYINLKLKDEYVNSKGFYSTNDSEKITYTLENAEKQITSDKTPVLEKKQYKVTYEINAPAGTTADTTENTEEEHSPLVKVTKKNTTPMIDGYNFKGWEIATDGVTEVNENVFEMPENDVVIRATWTKQGIAKRMDGTVKEKNRVQVGDIINYNSKGTYNWDIQYASYYGAGVRTLNSTEGNPFNVSSWRVLSVGDDGNIEMVPVTPTNGTVNLGGAQGYNNAVKLLNDACSSLYGDISKGIRARSICTADIEKIIKNIGTYTLPSAATNPEQISSAYTKEYSYYPSIYIEENLSVIDGNTNESGLNLNEQDEWIKSNDYGAIQGRLQASTSIQPYETYYELSIYRNLNIALGDTYKKILLPENYSNRYWLASRCVYDDYGYNAEFKIRYMSNTGFYGYSLFQMNSAYDFSCALFPVVSLNSKILEESTVLGVDYIIE